MRATATNDASALQSKQDYLRKLSTRLVREFDFLAVGGAAAAKLAEISSANSVQSASWPSFRNMPRCTAIPHGAAGAEVNQAFTAQTRSSCNAPPKTLPKVIAGLRVGHWACSKWGASHHSDGNAANSNLARSGPGALAQGCLAPLGVELCASSIGAVLQTYRTWVVT